MKQSPFRRASRAVRSLDLPTRRRRDDRLDRKSPRRTPASAGSPVRNRLARVAPAKISRQQVLAELCRQIGCDSGALALLDDTTASLLVRVQAGLPRFVASRELAEATADLEALCGHAVVLENDRQVRLWQPPAECRAALCVPVSTTTEPLGTLWLFSDTPRTFSDVEVNLAETAANRLARLSAPAPLEAAAAVAVPSPACSIVARSDDSLASSSFASAPTASQLSATMASIAPAQQGQAVLAHSRFGEIDLAAWSQDASRSTSLGPISEWIDFGGGRLTLAIGESLSGDRSLASAFLRGALRTHAREAPSAGKLLDRLNRVLAELFEDQGLAAHLFVATLDLGTGFVGYASAGDMLAVRMRASGWQSLRVPSLPLGLDPLATYAQYHLVLEPGETLAFVTAGAEGVRGKTKGSIPASGWGVEELAKWLSLTGWQSAADLAAGAALSMPPARPGERPERATLVVKRESPWTLG